MNPLLFGLLIGSLAFVFGHEDKKPATVIETPKAPEPAPVIEIVKEEVK